ncbi:U-box domain-containing protein 14-like [Wolffia australiana]
MEGIRRRRELAGEKYGEAAADYSGAFSDCNSDHSGEFTAESNLVRRLRLSTISDELLCRLISNLRSESSDARRAAAMELRLLAKHSMENRVEIAKAGAIGPLISIISDPEQQLQEHGVTAILNLSLCDENKDSIVAAGGIKALVTALSSGTSTAKENAACALLRLAQVEENKILIGRSGAISPLVSLLERGSLRGKKDAATALYTLCSTKENKVRAVEAGIMKSLVEFMADLESGMVDKAAYVVNLLVDVAKGRTALVEEDGIPVLVELLETGSQRQMEAAISALARVCEQSAAHCAMVAREGAIPPLVAFSQSGGLRSKQKAEVLIRLLRQTREEN